MKGQIMCEYAHYSSDKCALGNIIGSKSLRSYDIQFQPSRFMRTSLLNLKKDGKIVNLPPYAISLLSRFGQKGLMYNLTFEGSKYTKLKK